VEAIFLDENIPEGQEGFVELNAELSLTTPVITEQKEPLV
jgi:ferredoxin